MRIQFILELYVYGRRLYKKDKFYGSFICTGLTYVQVLYHYWAADYIFKLHDITKRCFILLSHYRVVKDFELFRSISHFKCAINAGIPWNLFFRYSLL